MGFPQFPQTFGIRDAMRPQDGQSVAGMPRLVRRKKRYQMLTAMSTANVPREMTRRSSETPNPNTPASLPLHHGEST
jgi:hypothetical protein